MFEDEMINFYTGLFKLCPKLVDLDKKDLYGRLTIVVKQIHGIELTRDHVERALQLFTGNRIKRRWDLKYTYGVLLFLENKTLDHQRAHDVLKSLFNERTRPGVIESMQRDAVAMMQSDTPEQIVAFKADVREKYSKKSLDKDAFVFT